jgi:hypothetical protein
VCELLHRLPEKCRGRALPVTHQARQIRRWPDRGKSNRSYYGEPRPASTERKALFFGAAGLRLCLVEKAQELAGEQGAKVAKMLISALLCLISRGKILSPIESLSRVLR